MCHPPGSPPDSPTPGVDAALEAVMMMSQLTLQKSPRRFVDMAASRRIRKQRRTALGGRWPSMSNLAAFAGDDDTIPEEEDVSGLPTMRRCSSEPHLHDSAAAAAPWQVYRNWRESNPHLPQSMCQAYADSLLSNSRAGPPPAGSNCMGLNSPTLVPSHLFTINSIDGSDDITELSL